MIFPTNFLWGASTSAFQVEGGYNEGGKGVATTDLGARRPGIADNKVAADHYHHWKEDVDLMAELGLKVYRMGFAWSRIMPDATCTPNPVPGKAAWPGLRCPVAVALSEDGGLTFPIIRWMERGEGYMGDENKTNNKQYEYPYLMQGRDGMLHLAYAARTRQGIKYVRFSEQDVLGAKRETVGLYNPTAAQSR